MNYAKIIHYDIANWNGINTSIYLSGCHFHCDGCQNPEAQDFNYGEELSFEVIDDFIELCKDDNIKGVCILGGEPFHQNLSELFYFIKRIKAEVNKPICIWTGYLFEDLLEPRQKPWLIAKRDILDMIDVLIDGRYEKDKRDLTLLYRGSTNQRVIDVQKSLKQKEIVKII